MKPLTTQFIQFFFSYSQDGNKLWKSDKTGGRATAQQDSLISAHCFSSNFFLSSLYGRRRRGCIVLRIMDKPYENIHIGI